MCVPAKYFREASRSLPSLPSNSARNKDLFCLNYANDPAPTWYIPFPRLPSQEWSSLTGLSARESATTSLVRPDPRHKADFVLCAEEVILACRCTENMTPLLLI